MKKTNAKLNIPKVKAIHYYQQVKNIKRDGDTDPTTPTTVILTGIMNNGW
ncbi:hypothetical protein [Mucilaginibacter sp. PPCGB 2223]|nr:hypothetical protein [Mucilaginibacter sp. PPCGB 2223]